MNLFSPLTDALIRRKVAMERTPLDAYQVRFARTAAEYEDAFALVHAAYLFTGIQEHASPNGMRIVAQHPLSESTVIVAYEGEQLVGTMTVIQDSPAGLPIAKEYPETVGRLRARGARLVEYAALAVIQRCWHSGVTQLLSMAAYNFARRYLGATHTFIGVNPKAAPFYRAVFNFQELAAGQRHTELRAPVVGLLQDMHTVEDFLRAKYKKPMQSGRLSVEHFGGDVPSCITMPPQGLTPDAFARWKLSRDVFQELFLRRSNRIATLSDEVQQYLRTQRTTETLRAAEVSQAARQILAEVDEEKRNAVATARGQKS